MSSSFHHGAAAWLGTGLVGQIAALFSAIFLGVAAYAGLILFLQVPEARDLLDQVRGGRKGQLKAVSYQLKAKGQWLLAISFSFHLRIA